MKKKSKVQASAGRNGCVNRVERPRESRATVRRARREAAATRQGWIELMAYMIQQAWRYGWVVSVMREEAEQRALQLAPLTAGEAAMKYAWAAASRPQRGEDTPRHLSSTVAMSLAALAQRAATLFETLNEEQAARMEEVRQIYRALNTLRGELKL